MSLFRRILVELGCSRGLNGSIKPSCQLTRSHILQHSYLTSTGTVPTPALTPEHSDRPLEATAEGDDAAHDVQDSATHPQDSVAVKKSWTRWAKRCGVIAVKLGMTQLWSKEGTPMAVTVLQVRFWLMHA
jgi:hypothetical protein